MSDSTLHWIIGDDEPRPPEGRVVGWVSKNLRDNEGADAILTDGEKHHVMVEAKRGSDFLSSYLSEHFQQQLTRMLSTGLWVIVVIEGDPTGPAGNTRTDRRVNIDIFTKAMATLSVTVAPNGNRAHVAWIPRGTYFTFLEHIAKKYARRQSLTDGVDPDRVYLLGKVRGVDTPKLAFRAMLESIKGVTAAKALAVINVFSTYDRLCAAWDVCPPVDRPKSSRHRFVKEAIDSNGSLDEEHLGRILLREGRAQMLMLRTVGAGRDKVPLAVSRRIWEILWTPPTPVTVEVGGDPEGAYVVESVGDGTVWGSIGPAVRIARHARADGVTRVVVGVESDGVRVLRELLKVRF